MCTGAFLHQFQEGRQGPNCPLLVRGNLGWGGLPDTSLSHEPVTHNPETGVGGKFKTLRQLEEVLGHSEARALEGSLREGDGNG